MLRIIRIVLLLIFLMPVIMPITMPAVLSSLSGSSEAWAQTGRTDLMQQSDHKRRATNQKKPKPVQQQTAGVIPVEANAKDGDYVVLGILVASVVILAFIATRGRKIRFKSRSRTRS
jgi:hypothetical protein